MKKLVPLLVALLVLSTNHAFAQTQKLPTNLFGIVRVFMHEPNDFSFLVIESDGTGQLIRYSHVVGSASAIRFVFDVKEGTPMWLESNLSFNRWSGDTCTWMKIHLRRPEDITGAGGTIRVGKATRHGTTTVVQ